MKKFLSFILVLVMVFALCACDGGGSTAPADTPTPAPTDVPAPEPSGDGGPLKVGFIYLHDNSSTYDKNFLNAAKAACDKMGVECINKTNIPEGGECYDAAAELVDAGCAIVFADSFGHESYILQAAKDFPNVQFCHATGTMAHTANVPNFHNAFASIYQGRYLAGVAAGMKLNEMIESGKIKEDEAFIGYIGAYPYAEVISGYTSFFLGARSICPSATMMVQYTNSWYDETLEKEAANNLISKGCVLISQHADSMGAPSACEIAGVPDVSYNGSTIDACPNTFIVSSRIDWEPYFEYMIQCVFDGKPIDTDWTGTMDTKSVVITDVNTAVAAEGTVEKLAEVADKLTKGEIQVFDTSTFTVEGQHLTEYLADVDTDEEFTPDTNVIKDGVFMESTYRSAPYFDIIIDDIAIIG